MDRRVERTNELPYCIFRVKYIGRNGCICNRTYIPIWIIAVRPGNAVRQVLVLHPPAVLAAYLFFLQQV
jgi:hypothetical protein